MGKASSVMYTIANIFNWIILFLCIAGIVLSILGGAGVADTGFGYGYLVLFIIDLIVAIVTIWMVRKAKAKGTSKGWDILFIVLGALDANIFYILGGIFGVCEKR